MENNSEQQGAALKAVATRISWLVMAVGIAIAVIAASIGGVEMSRTGSFSSLVRTLRALGGATMVGGLVLILLAQRLPGWAKAWQSNQRRQGATDMQGNRRVGVFWAIALMTMIALTVIMWVVPFILPGILTLLITFLLQMFLPVFLITTCVYGRGLLRTFCIGALVPAGMSLIGMGWFSAAIQQAMFNRYGSPFRDLSRMGEENCMAAVVLTSCLLCGVVAVVTRVMLGVLTPPVDESPQNREG